MLNTCENRVYISRLLWGSRLARKKDRLRISCSWTNRNVLGIPWGWFCLPLSWGFHGCDAIQGKCWGCGMLWQEVVRGPRHGRRAFPSPLCRSPGPRGLCLGVSGCSRGVWKEEMQLWSPKSKMVLRAASALWCVSQMRWGGWRHAGVPRSPSQLDCSDFLGCLFTF